MVTQEIPTMSRADMIGQKEAYQSQATSIIKRYTLLSGGAALIPYNLVDIVSSSIAQTMMVREVCMLYNVPFSERIMNVAAWSAVGSAMTKAIEGVVESVLTKSNFEKSIDLTGAAISAIYVATVGEFYNLHFKNGGTLDDVQISDFADYFIKEIKKGDMSLATFTNPKALLNHLNIA